MKWLAVTTVFVLVACGGPAGDPALRRGDEALARSDPEEAVAEYRLALRQNPEAPELLAREARAAAELGRVDDVVDAYAALLAVDSTWATQAISDLLALARDAEARNDDREMALAVEAALGVEPAIGVGELARPLGEFYYDEGRWAEALVFLGRAADSETLQAEPELLYDLARAYRGVGDCASAIPLYQGFRDRVPPYLRAARSDVEYEIGECALELAETLHQEGELADALDRVMLSIDLGQPQARLDQAWFLRGQILSDLGRCGEAEAALAEVRNVSPTGVGPLVERADRMRDELRFGNRGGGRERGSRRPGGCL